MRNKAKKPTAAQRRQAKAGAARIAAGKKPTVGQKKAAKAIEVWDREQAALELLAEVPKKYYLEWSGRPTQSVHNQADTWGVPCRGATVSIPEVVRFLHDFLVENQSRLKGKGQSDWREMARQEEYLMARLKRLEKAGQLIPIEELQELHGRLIAALRGLGEQLERNHGGPAKDLLNATLETFKREIEQSPTATPAGQPEGE